VPEEMLDALVHKVNSVNRVAADPNATLDGVRKELRGLLAWLMQEHSLQLLRMVYAMMTYLYNTVGAEEGYASVESWTDNFKCKVGFCTSREVSREKQMVCSKCGHKGTATLTDTLKVPKSLSLNKCSQAARNAFVEAAIEYAEFIYPWFKFDQWRGEWENNTRTIQ